MKKVLLLFLSLTVIISAMAVNVYAEEMSGTSFEASVMRGLHILDEADVNNPDVEVTRGEFVRILMGMIDAPVSAVSDMEIPFADIKKGKTYTASVLYAASLGYVIGYGDGNFYPDKTMTVQEAANVILNVAGYAVSAEASGGYLTIAQSEGLLDGLSAGNTLTNKDLSKILYNALTVTVMEIKFSGGQSQVEKTNIPFMEKYMNLVRYRGIITSTYFTSLEGNTTCGEGNITIGDMTIANGYDKAVNYLGYKVEAYSEQYKSGDEEIIFAVPYKTNVTEVNCEDITGSVSETILKYQGENDSREKTVRISLEADKILNGKASPECTMAELTEDCSTILFIDNNNDKIADVVFAYKYSQMYVSNVSLRDSVIYGKYTFSGAVQVLDLEKADKVSIVKDGKPAQLGDMSEDDILTVTDTTFGGIREVSINASSKRVTGTVTGINSVEDLVYIDNTEYRKSKLYKAAISGKDPKAKNIVIGTTGTFYLDSRDRIVAIEISSTAKKYGYLKKFYINEDVENDISMKVLGEDGDWQLYKLRQKINIDGLQYSSDKVLEALGDGSFVKPQLIAFELNSDGMVVKIDSGEESDDTTRDDLCYRKFESIVYRSANQSFDSECYLTGNTVSFMIPALFTDDSGIARRYTDREIAGMDDKFFVVKNGSVYSDWGIYSFYAYNVDEFGETKQIMMETTVEDVGQFSTGNFLFSKLRYVIGTDGSEQISIEGLHGTNISASATVNSDVIVFDENGERVTIDYIERGDLLNLYFDVDDNIYRINVECKAQNRAKSEYQYSLHENPVILSGEIVNIDRERGYIILDDGLPKKKTLKVFLEKVSIYVCELDAKGGIKAGNINDVMNGDYVLIKGGMSNFDFIVIYK